MKLVHGQHLGPTILLYSLFRVIPFVGPKCFLVRTRSAATCFRACCSQTDQTRSHDVRSERAGSSVHIHTGPVGFDIRFSRRGLNRLCVNITRANMPRCSASLCLPSPNVRARSEAVCYLGGLARFLLWFFFFGQSATSEELKLYLICWTMTRLFPVCRFWRLIWKLVCLPLGRL